MTVELSVAFYNDKLDPKTRTIFFSETGATCKKSYREIIVRNVVRTRGSPEGFAEYTNLLGSGEAALPMHK